MSEHGMRFCTDCIHRRTPPHTPTTAEGTALSAGRIQAATEELRLYHQRRETENRRLQEEYAFDYRPHFAPWCARFTPDTEMVVKIRAAVADGDDSTIAEMRERGYDWTIDTANGVVRPIYALCAYQNGKGDCAYFESKAAARR